MPASRGRYVFLLPGVLTPGSGVNAVVLGLASAMRERYEPAFVITGWDPPPLGQMWLKLPGFTSITRMPSEWRRPSRPSQRRRPENYGLVGDGRGGRRRIWLQIGDLGVGRYLGIPRIRPLSATSGALPSRLSSSVGT